MSGELKACPRCGGSEFTTVSHKGRSYPQCSKCHFWTTGSEKTWHKDVVKTALKGATSGS